MSLHAFAYGNGNPLFFVDPYGEWSWEKAGQGLVAFAKEAGIGTANAFLSVARPLAALAGGTTGQFDDQGNFTLANTASAREELSAKWETAKKVANAIKEDPIGIVAQTVEHAGKAACEAIAACYVAATHDGTVGDSASEDCGHKIVGATAEVWGTITAVVSRAPLPASDRAPPRPGVSVSRSAPSGERS